jgi:hypothetical protein
MLALAVDIQLAADTVGQPCRRTFLLMTLVVSVRAPWMSTVRAWSCTARARVIPARRRKAAGATSTRAHTSVGIPTGRRTNTEFRNGE